jgi:hypothetical protein
MFTPFQTASSSLYRPPQQQGGGMNKQFPPLAPHGSTFPQVPGQKPFPPLGPRQPIYNPGYPGDATTNSDPTKTTPPLAPHTTDLPQVPGPGASTGATPPEFSGGFDGLPDEMKFAVIKAMGGNHINNPQWLKFHNSLGKAYDGTANGRAGTNDAYKQWVMRNSEFGPRARPGVLSYNPYTGHFARAGGAGGDGVQGFANPAQFGITGLDHNAYFGSRGMLDAYKTNDPAVARQKYMAGLMRKFGGGGTPFSWAQG